uniref:Uncharacterized protein n=1 Tax=Anguilla anguilla TaxID=7936 RepID=A0A0E9UJ93_ANGAN
MHVQLDSDQVNEFYSFWLWKTPVIALAVCLG